MTRRQRLGVAVILVWCALVVLAIIVTGRLYLGAFLALALLLALPCGGSAAESYGRD